MSLADIPRLRAFVLTLDLGSVSAAASVLGYTQSAVSQQLAALEREVGEILIDRSQRPLRATRAGDALRPHAERILADVAGAEAALDELDGGTRRVRLAAFASALSSFVPAAVRDARRVHAGLVVQVHELQTKEAIEHLRAGEADLALVHYMPGVAVPDTTGLVRRRLMTDELYVVMPGGHRLARRESVSIVDLEDEPLGLPRRDTPAGRFRSVIEQLCAEAGFTPRAAYEIDDLPAAQAFVAAGISVGTMHGLTLVAAPSGLVARPLAERPAGAREIEALARADARTPIVEDLLDRLAQAAQAQVLKGPPAAARSR